MSGSADGWEIRAAQLMWCTAHRMLCSMSFLKFTRLYRGPLTRSGLGGAPPRRRGSETIG